MGNKLIDYEDNMKNMVQGPVLKRRREVCDECQYKGENNFCQKNAKWLPDFQMYRYNECPIKIWSYNW